jgi:hypothetical protein
MENVAKLYRAAVIAFVDAVLHHNLYTYNCTINQISDTVKTIEDQYCTGLFASATDPVVNKMIIHCYGMINVLAKQMQAITAQKENLQ